MKSQPVFALPAESKVTYKPAVSPYNKMSKKNINKENVFAFNFSNFWESDS